MLEEKKSVDKDYCEFCGHSFKGTDNCHGPDQNDFELNIENDELTYLGSCTYCKECNTKN